MAEFEEEEGMEVAAMAAKILLSLRNRKLQRWPEWVPRPSKEPASAAEHWRRSEEPVVEEEEEEEWELPPVPVGWPKRARSLRRVEARANAWSLSLEDLLVQIRYGGSAGSGAPSRREDGARLRSLSPRGRERVKVESMAAGRPEMPPCYVATAGSGPSTSGVDRARSRTVKARAKVAARKESMAASSPDTPLDYATAVGSGASSSGDDGARSSPAKLKALGASGSVGASSGDEGSSSPAKRARADLDAAAANVGEPKNEEKYRDEKGHLLFDLNEDIAPWQD